MAVGFEMLLGNAETLPCKHADALHAGLLGDFDIGKHGAPFLGLCVQQ